MTNYVISGASDASFNGTYVYNSAGPYWFNGTYYLYWWASYNDWIWVESSSYSGGPPYYWCSGTGSSPLEVTAVSAYYGSYSGAVIVAVVVTIGILSFTPNFGIGASVAIVGAGFTGATAVKFNGVSASSFVVSSDTLITAVSPASFTAGLISVTFTSGTVYSSSSTFYPACTIVSNTTSVNTDLLVVTGSTETILPGCNLTIPLLAGTAVSISWDVKVSEYLPNIVKSGIFRLRRTSVSGAILASLAFGDTSDYTTGDKSEWSSSYSDTAPTDGVYIITVQSTNGNASTATYSALRTFQLVYYASAAAKYRHFNAGLLGGLKRSIPGGCS